ncbi:MAG: hypothetical protein ABL973_15945 [Micropepsaceae bacterium]
MNQQRSSNRTPESHSLWGAAVLSALMHAAALAAAFIIWPKLAPPVLLPSDIVPVDLEVADETNVMPQEEAPQPVPQPEQLPMPQMAEPQMAPPEAPPPPPPDDDSFALQEQKEKPTEDPKPKPPQPKFAMAPQPRAKPKPDMKKKDDFDIDKIANLVNKIDDKPPNAEQKPGQQPQATRTMKGAGAQSAMTANEIDAFKSQLRKCWNVPVGAPDPAALVFRIRIYLNQDGTVSAPPELVDQAGLGDPYFRAAVDSAKRAVHMCSPFQMPAEKYAAWNDITITFDPTKMAGY